MKHFLFPARRPLFCTHDMLWSTTVWHLLSAEAVLLRLRKDAGKEVIRRLVDLIVWTVERPSVGKRIKNVKRSCFKRSFLSVSCTKLQGRSYVWVQMCATHALFVQQPLAQTTIGFKSLFLFNSLVKQGHNKWQILGLCLEVMEGVLKSPQQDWLANGTKSMWVTE